MPQAGIFSAVFFIDQTLCELRELLPDGLLPVRWRTRDYWDHLFESVGMKICFSRAEEHIHWHRDVMELFRLFKNTGVNSRNLLNVPWLPIRPAVTYVYTLPLPSVAEHLAQPIDGMRLSCS